MVIASFVPTQGNFVVYNLLDLRFEEAVDNDVDVVVVFVVVAV